MVTCRVPLAALSAAFVLGLPIPVGAQQKAARECDSECPAVIEAGAAWFSTNSGIPASELVLDHFLTGTVPSRLPLQARERPLQGQRLNLLRQQLGLRPAPEQREDIVDCDRTRKARNQVFYCYFNSGRGAISFDIPEVAGQEATLFLRFTISCADPVADGRFPQTGDGVYALTLSRTQGRWTVSNADRETSEGDFRCDYVLFQDEDRETYVGALLGP